MNQIHCKRRNNITIITNEGFSHYANTIKGKPFKERIVIGITLQIQKPGALWLDLNAQLGYRFTGRITAGTGWNERIIYDTKRNEFNNRQRIFGVRSFIHFKLKENFCLKADVESMNASIPLPGTSSKSLDEQRRMWVWTYFAGIKKDFQYSKKLFGNIQLVYNIYDALKRSPYVNKFNIRIGFEYKFKKK